MLTTKNTVIITLAIIAIGIGIYFGGYNNTLHNGAIICLECIGIG